jgi:putative membrane protein
MPPLDEEPDPRISLANERTFLAYNRTALALVVGGLAVSGSDQVLDAPGWVHVVGIPLIAVGAAVGWFSRHRYAEVQEAVRRGDPLPPPPLVRVLSLAVALVAVAALVVVVAFAR